METSQINLEIAAHLALIAADAKAPPTVRRDGTTYQPKRGWDGAHGRNLINLLTEHVFVVSDYTAKRDRVAEHIAVAVNILRRPALMDKTGAEIRNVTHYLRQLARQEAERNSAASDVEMTRSQVSACQRKGIPLRHNSGEVDDETFVFAGINSAFPGDDDHTNRLDGSADNGETSAAAAAGMQALRGVLATAGLDAEQVDDLLTLMVDELDGKPKYAQALRAYQDAPAADPDGVATAEKALIAARGTAAETISGKHELGEPFDLNKAQWSGAVSLIIGSWTGQPGIASIEDADAVWVAARFVRARNKLMKAAPRRRK